MKAEFRCPANLFIRRVDREEDIDGGVLSNSLTLQREGEVDFSLGNQRSHVDLDRTSEVFLAHGGVD